jgi:preprotein translocase subunit Sec63
LKDIETLNEISKAQSGEIAILKFENDKLHNLYNNKESLLEQKRNELDQAYANYEEMVEEKNYK